MKASKFYKDLRKRKLVKEWEDAFKRYVQLKSFLEEMGLDLEEESSCVSSYYVYIKPKNSSLPVRGMLRFYYEGGRIAELINLDSSKMWDRCANAAIQLDFPKSDRQFLFLKETMEYFTTKEGIKASNECECVYEYC